MQICVRISVEGLCTRAIADFVDALAEALSPFQKALVLAGSLGRC